MQGTSFGHKVIHGSVSLVLQGYRMNVMTHGLEKWSPLLPLGIDVQSHMPHCPRAAIELRWC